ncbi:hypothetical protein [Kitasatospora sp. NBC_00315]|uniref:hypothetical protein n=1 Tax=Kitasatospora sp. NBC_00315 TaxID=2975963 RepID=UPI00325533A2
MAEQPRDIRHGSPDDTQGQDERTVKRLCLGVGLTGLLLPVVLPIGNSLFMHRAVWLVSISASYYTGMRNFFVGGMCAMGVFLVCYRYDRREDRLSSVAGLLAVLVALFPTLPPSFAGRRPTHFQQVTGVFHEVFATALFMVLAYFCLRLFRDAPRTDRRRRRRALVYLLCGGALVAGIALIAVFAVLHLSWGLPLTAMYAGESLGVISFGVAWLVRSEALEDAATALRRVGGRMAMAASGGAPSAPPG